MPARAEAGRALPGEAPLGAALIAVALAAPLLFGAAHEATQLGLLAATLAVFAGYVVVRRQRGVRLVPFVLPAALATGAIVVQLVPLPAPLVAWLSPAAYEARRAFAPAAFLPLTVDVPATWMALVRALTCLLMLVAGAGLWSSQRMARRALGALGLLGGGFALLALGQRALHLDRIYGVYAPRSTPGFGFFGSFVDVNHAAALLGLGCLCAAGRAAASRGLTRVVYAAAALLAATALLYSGSRSGVAGVAVGGALLTAVLLGQRLGVVRGLGATVVVLMVATAGALWIGDTVRARFVTATSLPELVANQKTRGWRDGMAMAVEYRWTGVGRGAFESPVNAYRRDDEEVRLVYPENLGVQLASEYGLPLAFLLIGLTLATAARLVPALAALSADVLGGAAGVVAVVVHDLGDFSLELLGVALPATLALAAVVGRAERNERRHATRETPRQPPLTPLRRAPLWLCAATVGLGALTLAAGSWAAQHTLGADWQAARTGGSDEAALTAAMARHPADDYLALVAAESALRRRDPNAMRHLNRALRLHPSNWQTHRLAGRLLVAMGRRPQAALEYRLALEHGMGADYHELVRVLGPSVVEAVPQTPAALLGLGQALLTVGAGDLAEAAAARAIEVAPEREAALAGRVKLAMTANRPRFLEAAARALAVEASEADSFALAARALAQARLFKAADATIAAGMRAHPSEGSLVLVGARLRLDAGDVGGAHLLLARASGGAFSLAERREAELLLGDIADRAGEHDMAVQARMRARLLERQMKSMTYNREDK